MMFILQATNVFITWYNSLRDHNGKAKIRARLKRLRRGYFGDIRLTHQLVAEIRFHGNKGYRIYFIRHPGNRLSLLLGGDKRHQQQDINLAHRYSQKPRVKAFYL